MADITGMIDDLADVLDNCISTRNIALSSDSDIFEAYIFGLVVRAAREEGATISYQDVNGRNVTNLLFRNSPGLIHSQNKNYTHGVIQFVNKPILETHVGVKVAGKSGVLHEADIAVLDRAEAEKCRRNNVSPRSSKILISVECKFYSSSLQLHLARSFLGLVSDFSVKEPFFVSNTESNSVEKLLSHRTRHWEKNICPTCINNEVDRLAYEFRIAFKNYKAR